MTSKPRIVFAGTPHFAVPSLRALCAAGFTPIAVYTQPDRPAGRGRKLTPSPVKACALDYSLSVMQPESLRLADAQAALRALEPDLMIVVAYGQLLPPAVLATPRRGCVNVHASLLPRWRGAAPIQRAIAAGDAQTGVCIMAMDEGLDTGAVYARAACPIGDRTTAAELHDTLAMLGASTLTEVLPAILDGTAVAQPQADQGITYAAKLSKSEARLDWRRPAAELDRLVRAFNPFPVAHACMGDEVWRIWQACLLPGTVAAAPGTVIAQGPDGIDTVCGDGRVLRLLRLQPPGRTVQSAADVVNARQWTGRRWALQ